MSRLRPKRGELRFYLRKSLRTENQFHSRVPQLAPAETIPDRHPIPRNVAGTEFDVVVNQVEAHFGPNESIVPEVGADAAANVSHEVIAAGVVGVPCQGAEVDVPVESEVFAANSSQQLSRNRFSNPWRPDSIDSPEDRAIRFGASVEALTRPPGELSFDPHTARHEEVRTNAGVCASSKRREKESSGSRGGA